MANDRQSLMRQAHEQCERTPIVRAVRAITKSATQAAPASALQARPIRNPKGRPKGVRNFKTDPQSHAQSPVK